MRAKPECADDAMTTAECEQCGGLGATKRVRYDPWGRIYSQEYVCNPCEDNYEPPEPDYEAPSVQERYEQAWEQKRKLR